MAREVNNIALTQLSNGAHFTFMQMVLERAAESEVVNTKLSSEISVLKSAFAVEDEKLKIATKSELTKTISSNDALRDSYYTGFKGTIRGLLVLPQGDMLTAAEKLWSHIDNYKIRTNSQLDKQTGMMTNFIDDLEKKYSSEVSTLGLTALIAAMKEANNNVLAALKSRDTEGSTKVVGAMKAARAATDDAYRSIVKKVNALALIEGDADYASFIDALNAQIVRYKREALGQKASASEAGTEADTTDTTDTSGSDVIAGEDSDGNPTFE